MPSVQVQRMDHFTILTDRTEETRAFYAELGLLPGPRPAFSRDGLWLYVEGRPLLHVIETDAMPEPRRGVLDHMAFFTTDIENALAWVRSKNIRFRLQRAPAPFDIWQMFFPDPNGAEVELDFAPGEAAPAGWEGKPMVHIPG